MDQDLLLALNGLRTPLLDDPLGFLGNWGYMAFPALVALLAARTRTKQALRSMLDGWLAYLASMFVVESIVKPIIDRPRPSSVAALEGSLHLLGRASSSPSFPSGSATACAAGVTWLVLRHRGDTTGRVVLALAAALALVTSLARVYAGAHWPSDVIVGWVFGALTAIVVDRVTKSPTPHNAVRDPV